MTNETSEETKVCNRCGRTLPIEHFNMVRYKNKKPTSRWSICKDCQNIEARRRYLLEHNPESPLLDKINRLYAKHEEAGRSIPTERGKSTVEDIVDELLGG